MTSALAWPMPGLATERDTGQPVRLSTCGGVDDHVHGRHPDNVLVVARSG